MFPGRWEVAEMAENHGAQAFWRKVIRRFTGEGYEEIASDNETWVGPIQVFTT